MTEGRADSGAELVCQNCGFEHGGTVKFCPRCGQPQSVETTIRPQQHQASGTQDDESEKLLWEGESKDLLNLLSGGTLVHSRYRLTERMLYFREGIVTTTTEQVPLWAVRDIDIREGLIQRTRGVGDVIVQVQHSDYTGRNVVTIMSIKEPEKVAELVNHQAQRERLAYQQRYQTRYFGR